MSEKNFNFDNILKNWIENPPSWANNPAQFPANQQNPQQQFDFGNLTGNNRNKPVVEVSIGSVPELIELLKQGKNLTSGSSSFASVLKWIGVVLLLAATPVIVLETQSSPKVRAKLQNLAGIDIGDPWFSPSDAYAKWFGTWWSADRLNSENILDFEKNTTWVWVAASGANILPESGHDAYFTKWQSIAISESRFGIMPSVTLVQWRIESGAGSSRLATSGNNHFGMKIGTYNTIMNAGTNLARYIPQAPAKHKPILVELFQHIEYVKQNFNGSSDHSDDHKNEAFVNFKTPESSFAAHTLLLLFGVKKVASGNANVVRIQGRYLPFLSASDFRGQLAAIKIAWYATEESYHLYGIKWIEKSWINKLDKVNLQRNRQIEEAIMWYFEWLSKRVR